MGFISCWWRCALRRQPQAFTYGFAQRYRQLQACTYGQGYINLTLLSQHRCCDQTAQQQPYDGQSTYITWNPPTMCANCGALLPWHSRGAAHY